MFQLRQQIRREPACVSLLTLALCVVMFAAGASAQEAPDSGSLIKPPTIKPPTVRSQTSSSRNVTTNRRRKRRPRRTPRRVAAKPGKLQTTLVKSTDSNVDVPVPEPPPAPTPRPKPKGPISGGVLNGRAISLPVPPYPAIARAAKAAGTVVVQVLIDENGKVMQAHAVSGHPLLRKAAEEAALTARFAPTQLSGQPVKVTGVITYNFIPQ